MKLSDLSTDNIAESKRLASLLRKSIGRSWGITPRKPSRNPPGPVTQQNTHSMNGLHSYQNGHGTDRGEDAPSISKFPSGIPSKLRHQRYFGIKTPGAPI